MCVFQITHSNLKLHALIIPANPAYYSSIILNANSHEKAAYYSKTMPE